MPGAVTLRLAFAQPDFMRPLTNPLFPTGAHGCSPIPSALKYGEKSQELQRNDHAELGLLDHFREMEEWYALGESNPSLHRERVPS